MTAAAPTFEVRTIVGAFRRRKWLLAIAVCGCLGASLAMSLTQDKTYLASSTVLLSDQQEQLQPGTALSDMNALQNQVATQALIVNSPGVRALVRKGLGRDVAGVLDVSAAGVATTRVLAITVTASSSAVAAKAANAYAQGYVDYRKATSTAAVSAFTSALGELNSDSQKKLAQLDEQIAAKGGSASEVQRLRVEREGVASQLLQSQQQYTQARLTILARGSGASLLALASPPSEPATPQPLKNALYGLAIGALLGIAIILLAEQLNDRIATVEDLNIAAPGVPVLASIPTDAAASKGRLRSLLLAEPFAPTAEAYRTLRTNLSFLGPVQMTQVIQVTSALPQEGKSTTAANLAVALAMSGERVILVGADLRRPQVHRFFGIPNDRGLSSLIASGEQVGSSLREVPMELGSLSLLAAGPRALNANELLAGSRVGRIIAELRVMADYVVLDTSPVLPVADALLTAVHADTIIVVVHAGHTRRQDLTKALGSLLQTGTHVAGIVLNNVPLTKDAYSYERESTKSDGGEVSVSS